MAKKTKVLTYKDFLQPNLSDKPSKLFLSSEDGITDFYLEVLSDKHPKLKREIVAYGIAEQEVYAKAHEITDKVDRVLFVQDSLTPLRKDLALSMVTGGNFDFHINVLENPINCDAVIARSFDSGKYLEKK
jgi:hypothetical protein